MLVALAALIVSLRPLAAETPQHWSDTLQKELDQHIAPGCDGAMTVVKLELSEHGGRVHMSAVVRLDWPPGMRQRPFDVSGRDEETTYQQLVNIVLYYHADVWKGCVI